MSHRYFIPKGSLQIDTSLESSRARHGGSSFPRPATVARFLLPVFAIVLPTLCHAVDRPDPRPPNFIVILADDLGYGDLGCQGSEVHRTPNIDRLAEEGVRLTDFYVTSPVCTPTRVALLTGRSPVRVGFWDLLWPTSTGGLPHAETTMAEWLKAAGYTTGLSGKWHLGHASPEQLPTGHGFDSWYGMPYPNDMGPGHPVEQHFSPPWPPMPMMRGTETVEAPINPDLLTQQYTAEAVRFIAENHHRPFFLLVSHAMPHTIIGASTDFRGRSRNGIYGDAVEELDWSVGEIRRVLRAFDLESHTLVFFTSDNGAALHRPTNGTPNPILPEDGSRGSNAPLRAGKQFTFEGGVRVPAIAFWPGQIPAGRVVRDPALIADLLPTFAEFADLPLPAGKMLDGRSIAPVLNGETDAGPERPLFFGSGTITACRLGKWKLVLPDQPKWLEPPPSAEPMLFDLEEDIGETRDLSRQYPGEFQRLLELIRTYEDSLASGELMEIPAH